MNKFLIVVSIIGLMACNEYVPATDSKILDFGSFTIEVPQTWSAVEEQGIDSYVGGIAIDSTDTLHFDLGWYSNSLYEYDPIVRDSSILGQIDTSMVDLREITFVNNTKKIDLDHYRKNNVLWDTIDGRPAKIVYTRKKGNGVTGVYIDSVWGSGSAVDRFNLYGENLKTENEERVLKACRTLKFRRK